VKNIPALEGNPESLRGRKVRGSTNRGGPLSSGKDSSARLQGEKGSDNPLKEEERKPYAALWGEGLPWNPQREKIC